MPDEKALVEKEEKEEAPYIPRYRVVDEDARRAAEKEASEDAEKFVVTEATPSSGGIFPPSAVVTPFSADVVAAHTPGEPVPEAEEQKKSQEPAT
jgi:hypothetical protein